MAEKQRGKSLKWRLWRGQDDSEGHKEGEKNSESEVEGISSVVLVLGTPELQVFSQNLEITEVSLHRDNLETLLA